MINEVKLRFNVEKIISTDGWGFNLLYSPGYLHAVTINVFLIKNKLLTSKFTSGQLLKINMDLILSAGPILLDIPMLLKHTF